MGKVEGETTGVGVWLTIEEIVNPEGMVTTASGPYTVARPLGVDRYGGAVSGEAGRSQDGAVPKPDA